ncbi:MAG: DUF2267 domain-containing protein [Persicimonas sp.]
MEMTYDAFLDSLCHQTGVESSERAEAMACAFLRVLGEALLGTDRDALAAELAEPLSQALCSRPANQDYELEEFYERVGREEGVHAGRAREVAQVVGQTMARAVNREVITRLRRRLPEPFEEIFVAPHVDLSEPRLDRDARANERTISEGKHGSEKPLSEARPVEGQRDSIAAQENPYEETKIATGHESTDEDEHTLAGGKPGSDRPVSDTHEE